RGAWIAEYRTIAERARAKFHPALMPADRLPVRECRRRLLDQRGIVGNAEYGAACQKPPLDITLFISRPEICTLHRIQLWRGALAIAQRIFGVRDGKRGAERAAGVARRRLHENLVEAAVAKHLAIGDTIQGHAAGKTEIAKPSFSRERTRQAQHDL